MSVFSLCKFTYSGSAICLDNWGGRKKSAWRVERKGDTSVSWLLYHCLCILNLWLLPVYSCKLAQITSTIRSSSNSNGGSNSSDGGGSENAIRINSSSEEDITNSN